MFWVQTFSTETMRSPTRTVPSCSAEPPFMIVLTYTWGPPPQQTASRNAQTRLVRRKGDGVALTHRHPTHCHPRAPTTAQAHLCMQEPGCTRMHATAQCKRPCWTLCPSKMLPPSLVAARGAQWGLTCFLWVSSWAKKMPMPLTSLSAFWAVPASAMPQLWGFDNHSPRVPPKTQTATRLNAPWPLPGRGVQCLSAALPDITLNSSGRIAPGHQCPRWDAGCPVGGPIATQNSNPPPMKIIIDGF